MNMSSQPKSPAKHKQPPSAPQVRTAPSQATEQQLVNTRRQESPRKEKFTCLGCDKKFLLLLSHLERTKSCQSSYDMSAMRKEAEELHRQQMAARKLYLYHNDANESPKKRSASKEFYKTHSPEKKAASKEYYKKHTQEKKASSRKLYQESPEKKKEAMAAYNEKHKEDINGAMLDKYYESRAPYPWTEFTCSVCKETFMTKKSMDYHIENIHEGIHPSLPCQICEKKIGHKSLERHMKEVHGEEKHHCKKCPASFTRNTDLEKHIDEGWHYLTYSCKQCDKKLVFKTLGGLIEHTIVKQSREESTFSDGTKYEMYKSGILVTCKSHVKSTQLKEGEHVLCMPRKDKVRAAKDRLIKKEELINEGLQLAIGNSDAPKVELELKYKKHEDDGRRKCKWCYEYMPYATEYCEYRIPDQSWHLWHIE